MSLNKSTGACAGILSLSSLSLGIYLINLAIKKEAPAPIYVVTSFLFLATIGLCAASIFYCRKDSRAVISRRGSVWLEGYRPGEIKSPVQTTEALIPEATV